MMLEVGDHCRLLSDFICYLDTSYNKQITLPRGTCVVVVGLDNAPYIRFKHPQSNAVFNLHQDLVIKVVEGIDYQVGQRVRAIGSRAQKVTARRTGYAVELGDPTHVGGKVFTIIDCTETGVVLAVDEKLEVMVPYYNIILCEITNLIKDEPPADHIVKCAPQPTKLKRTVKSPADLTREELLLVLRHWRKTVADISAHGPTVMALVHKEVADKVSFQPYQCIDLVGLKEITGGTLPRGWKAVRDALDLLIRVYEEQP
jgi:hypothetical protein